VPKLLIAIILVAVIFAINTTSETQDQVRFCDKYVLIADQMNKTYSISDYMKENGVEGVLETNHCKNKRGRV
jgi:hypothetical protein|tara:strand:- start:8402 stop:8617 length:216 start_codon:yes stop_codon:yes gene_type:complete